MYTHTYADTHACIYIYLNTGGGGGGVEDGNAEDGHDHLRLCGVL